MSKLLPGINIQAPISSLIVSGQKVVETRTYKIPEKYLDKELYLVETPGKSGKFKARVIAIIKFTNCFQYKNIKEFRVEIPYDKDDFSRCYTFWKECKLADTDLQKIKETCPMWKPFIDNWYELVSRYENNEKMYEYMSELVEQGRLNAGWIKVDANTWKCPSY
jgi:hypothetical protein